MQPPSPSATVLPMRAIGPGLCLILSLFGCSSEHPAATTAPTPTGPPHALVSQERLMKDLAALPKGRAVRGTQVEQEGLVTTETLILHRLTELGYQPELQPLTWNLKYQADYEAKAGVPQSRPPAGPLADNTWHNIIVDLPGLDLPQEVLVVGAHFDAVPGTPGADDNGTGTAALLELARVLKAHPTRRTIRLAFFNLEEVGLKGSTQYVRTSRRKDEIVIGMVSLEMLGFYSDAPGSQRSPLPRIDGVFEPPTVGDFIGLGTISSYSKFCRRLDEEMRTAAPGLKTVVADFLPIPPPDFLRSDHAPFMLAGIPAVLLTDTSNFRNPNYHRASDTVETIDAARFALVVRGVAGAAYAIAEPPAQK